MRKWIFLLLILGTIGLCYGMEAEITDVNFSNPIFYTDTANLEITTTVSYYSSQNLYLIIDVEPSLNRVEGPVSGSLGEHRYITTNFTLNVGDYNSNGRYRINLILTKDADGDDIVDVKTKYFSVLKRNTNPSSKIPDNNIFVALLTALIAMFLVRKNE